MTVTAQQVDEWSAHLWHVSQHNHLVIGLSGRLQALANEMRAAVGLEEFGWNTGFPDARFGECSVHVDGCAGQETHTPRTGADDVSDRSAHSSDRAAPDWREPLGVHDLTRTVEVAQRLAAHYECTSPAYGAPGYAHCAACCYGTMIAATSMEEFETAQVLLAVPESVREIQRLKALTDGDAP